MKHHLSIFTAVGTLLLLFTPSLHAQALRSPSDLTSSWQVRSKGKTFRP